MSILKAISRVLFGAPKHGGMIGYLKLSDWWNSLGEVNQKRIARVYTSGGESLTKGEVYGSSYTASSFLSVMASWFSKDADRDLGYLIIAEAERRQLPNADIWDRFTLLSDKLALHYRGSDDPHHYSIAKATCFEMIDLAPNLSKSHKRRFPGELLLHHAGYDQLAIMLEREGAFQETIALCQKAKKQGWLGEWDSRIDRCRVRMEKASKKTKS